MDAETEDRTTVRMTDESISEAVDLISPAQVAYWKQKCPANLRKGAKISPLSSLASGMQHIQGDMQYNLLKEILKNGAHVQKAQCIFMVDNRALKEVEEFLENLIEHDL